MVLQQLTKKKAKEEVKKLVDKYNRILQSGGINRYKEEDTKAEFIEPLFEALGWDVRNIENDDEVVREEKISKGRVDYSFRINSIPKFFLEAKALKKDLDNFKFIEQAINYSWHKGCTWAILTNFEIIKIFNAEWKSANPLQAQFGQTLPCQLFLEKFDQLWLLSKESFEKKLLDTEAEKWGKKIKKISVDKLLLNDLTKFRDLLNKNILKNNSSKNLSGDDLDETVQRIIDRLIFVRTLEDKELEAPMLRSVIREDLNKRTYKKLNVIFRKIDDIYNSKLFTPHLCGDLDIDDEVLIKIINGLFNTNDKSVHYDFSAIDADVLGNIYEQYLGHILKKTDKRAKLSEGKVYRKEQGIYYTPTYVVDYIVKTTIGELAKDKKVDLKNIKILDPACGSGSFLMKAFDYLVTFDKKKNGETDQTKLDLTGATVTYGRKIEILKDNIFGVDLDPKAVEIAQLNLLLKAAEKKHRLPTLQENIRVGNSLINDSNVAGNRAFKWEEQFKEIMQKGGFDVVIGNPPWVQSKFLSENEKSYYSTKLITAKKQFDLFSIFIEKSINLLREKGYLGFIVPDRFITNIDYGIFRNYLLNNTSIVQIIHLGDAVFEEVNMPSAIIIVKKEKNKRKRDENLTKYIKSSNKNLSLKLKFNLKKQSEFLKDENFIFSIFSNKESDLILKKIKKESVNFSEIVNNSRGVEIGKNCELISKEQKGNEYVRFLVGEDICRYQIKSHRYLKLNDKNTNYKDSELYQGKKIIIRKTGLGINATLDEENFYVIQVIYIFKLKNKNFDELYLLGILNSKLMDFYYHSVFGEEDRKTFPHLTQGKVLSLPIRNVSLETQKNISCSVRKMLDLNKKIITMKNVDDKQELLKKIEDVDKEINKLVYKVYDLSEKEISYIKKVEK